MSRKKRHLKVGAKIFFFVEGYTEENYFRKLIQYYKLYTASTKALFNDSAKKIKVMDGNGDWVEYTKKILTKDPKFRPDSGTRIFIIFDKDQISDKKIDKMLKDAANLTINGSKCQIGLSNCSFEVWLLAHFQKMTPKPIEFSKRWQEQLEESLGKYLGKKYKKNKIVNNKQMEKILSENKVFEAIKNTEKISKISLDKQSTNIGPIVSDILNNRFI